MSSQFISLNVGGGRASIHLEREPWNAMDHVCDWKGFGLTQF